MLKYYTITCKKYYMLVREREREKERKYTLPSTRKGKNFLEMKISLKIFQCFGGKQSILLSEKEKQTRNTPINKLIK